MSGASEPWHLDKRVPLALILSLAVQTAAVVWWAAALSARVDDHDRRIGGIEAAAKTQADEGRKMSEALVRLDERMAGQTAILQRIEAQIARRP
jgi:hypothetical protein